jgi:hypothetical protein
MTKECSNDEARKKALRREPRDFEHWDFVIL